MTKRFVLEGVWSGYTSAQRKVCHRVVVTNEARYQHLHSITFSDGTYITLRPCAPHERVKELHHYDGLIEDCIRHGVTRVDDLPGDPI
jgi:hypothetical protein